MLTRILHLVTEPAVAGVISMGTPGPYNKQTIVLLDRSGAAKAIAKCALSPAARKLLENEAHWLQWLAAQPALVGSIPRLLAQAEVEEALVILQSPGAGRQCHGALQPLHVRFLAELHRASLGEGPFDRSGMYRAMQDRLERMRAHLTDAWRSRATEALSRFGAEFGSSPVPQVLAHRDFAPWNMLIQGERLFIFDWEYACTGYIPLYDLYHYCLMPRVLRRDVAGPEAVVVIKEVSQLYARVAQGGSPALRPDIQLLAYLLDLCLFYLESNDGNDAGDRVVRRYGELIDRFEEWRLT